VHLALWGLIRKVYFTLARPNSDPAGKGLWRRALFVLIRPL
jgi:hypothetical protein